MSLLYEVQAALLDQKSNVGAALLKLRYLAARLGSADLEDWVKYELEGYPDKLEVPVYRKTEIIFTGTFASSSEVRRNILISPYLIRHHAGDSWVDHDVRHGLLYIDGLIGRIESGGRVGINTGNLLLLIQDKIYENLVCVSVQGVIDGGVFSRIQSTVRTKLLDLTLELENSVPAAAEIVVGKPPQGIKFTDVATVSSIMQQHIYNAPVTQIASSGAQATITMTNVIGDKDAFTKTLIDSGIPEADVQELVEIVASEPPVSPDEPLGTKAKAWLSKKATQGGHALWGVSLAAGTELAKEAAKRFFFGT